jgi:predicted DNA-binding protein (UPF0251 family)
MISLLEHTNEQILEQLLGNASRNKRIKILDDMALQILVDAEKKEILDLFPTLKGQALDNAITRKLNQRGILSPRQLRRAIEEREFGFKEYGGKTILDMFDTTSLSDIERPADWEYVLQNIEDQVVINLQCKKRDKINPDWVLAYHLVYRRRYSKQESAERMGVSPATITRYLEYFFYEIALELYVGLHINDKTLEKFMHPSIIALRKAREKYGKKGRKGQDQSFAFSTNESNEDNQWLHNFN